jgi:hypothetical protein
MCRFMMRGLILSWAAFSLLLQPWLGCVLFVATALNEQLQHLLVARSNFDAVNI